MANEPITDEPKFDFIADADFRKSLESDYRELTRCIESGAWKCAHVISGSVVEAILTDYLIGVDYQKKTGKDPLKMELAPIIAACKDEKIITERTADLSSVVRSYRNLIHPGRVIRLDEREDQKTASIAKGLVDIVANEVAAAKEATYGFTAEQIANKIEKDSGAIAVLRHFLKETNDRERERLVAQILPGRFFFARELGDESSVADYQKCHRQTFDTLADESKTRIAKRFVKILKEESGDYVLAYENLFFRASDLKYIGLNDTAMVKEHLLARLSRDQSKTALGVLEGFGPFLSKYELPRVFDAYAKIVAYGKPQESRNRARVLSYMLYFDVPEDLKKTCSNA